jgi:PAS domain-containing protein
MVIVEAPSGKVLYVNRQTQQMTQATGEEVAVRSFRIDVPEEDLVDLRRRIAATRWPDRKTVPDRSQELNALPQFML